MVKPDGVQRKLVGEVIGRLEKKGLQMVAMKMMQIEPELAARHYGEHRGKPFYESLISFITSGPVVAMVWEGGECSLCIPGVNRCHRPTGGRSRHNQGGPGSLYRKQPCSWLGLAGECPA